MKNGSIKRGTLVFWGDNRPWWIVEWQPTNGFGSYWIIDASGMSGVATDDELSLFPVS
jgi:hypothetical protein